MSQTWAGRLAWIGITLAGLFADTGVASADSSALTPLADFILQSFPYQLQTDHQGAPIPATASPDWCYEVERDPSENWWEFQGISEDTQVHFNATRDAARIRLIFTQPSGRSGFASIFLALDVGSGGQVYQSFDLTKMNTGYTQLVSPPLANLPNGNPPACMNLASFLDAWLANLILQQTNGFTDKAAPVEDPNCNAKGGCGGTSVGSGGQALLWHKLVAGTPNAAGPFFSWNYNGRVHQIAYAVRILLGYASGQSSTGYVYLTIGYGGNSGAG